MLCSSNVTPSLLRDLLVEVQHFTNVNKNKRPSPSSSISIFKDMYAPCKSHVILLVNLVLIELSPETLQLAI